MCELPETTTQALVTHIAVHNSAVQTEQEATQYLASLATVTIASRTKLLNYTTMVQHFLGTLQLPMAVYMLDYYLPMLSPNEGYNETGLTMQSAGPIRQPWQPITLEFLFKGSEFGHWKVKGGQDAFAFRHPSLGKTEVFSLLASDAHHHKVSPIGTGRLVAMVQSRSLYGRHVSTSFLDPVFGAMMKQACRQTLKSLAAECLVGVRLGLLNFLTPVCVD